MSTHRPCTIKMTQRFDHPTMNRNQCPIRTRRETSVKLPPIQKRTRMTHFINATIGRINALFTFDISLVQIGTAALTSLNLRSISMITLGSPLLTPSSSSATSGADNGGFASSLCPGMRWRIGSGGLERTVVDIASTMSSRMSLISCSGSCGNLISKTASSLPEVIQAMGPSVVLEAAWIWSMLTPSMRIRD